MCTYVYIYIHIQVSIYMCKLLFNNQVNKCLSICVYIYTHEIVPIQKLNIQVDRDKDMVDIKAPL